MDNGSVPGAIVAVLPGVIPERTAVPFKCRPTVGQLVKGYRLHKEIHTRLCIILPFPDSLAQLLRAVLRVYCRTSMEYSR
jgi:hypothetical protein